MDQYYTSHEAPLKLLSKFPAFRNAIFKTTILRFGAKTWILIMTLKTLQLILNWFDKYQDWNDREMLVKLYKDQLIPEEKKELQESIESKDIVKFLDAIGDVVWVKI